MLRLAILCVLIALLSFFLVVRPRLVLKFTALVLYSSMSPWRGDSIPVWAGYLMGTTDLEGPPPSLTRLQDDVRMLGYVLVGVPLALIVAVLFL